MEWQDRSPAEATPLFGTDRERLRLVAQALAGTALAGKKDNGPDHAVVTTAAEQAAFEKLVANWRALIDQRLGADEGTMFDQGSK
jgi:putative DNA methylase